MPASLCCCPAASNVLRWKFIWSAHAHWGLQGFVPVCNGPPSPGTVVSRTRWLHADISKQGTGGQNADGSYFLGPPSFGTMDVDPITGFITYGGDTGEYVFSPFSNHDGSDGIDWTITDTHFIAQTQRNFPGTDIPQYQGRTAVTLSIINSEAAVAQVVDDLIAAVDPNSIPWGFIRVANLAADPLSLFPIAMPHWDEGQVNGLIQTGNTLPDNPITQIPIDAISSYAYDSYVAGIEGMVNKVKGFFQFKGQYAAITGYVGEFNSPNQPPAEVSRIGTSDGVATVTVLPPQLTPFLDGYVRLVAPWPPIPPP